MTDTLSQVNGEAAVEPKFASYHWHSENPISQFSSSNVTRTPIIMPGSRTVSTNFVQTRRIIPF